MTGAPGDAAVVRLVADADVVDADYEIVRPAEPRRDMAQPKQTHFAPSSAPAAGMEMLRRDAGRRGRDRPFAVRGGPAFWTFGVGLALAAFWASGGHVLVRHAPFASAAKTASGFSIAGVTSRIDETGARPVLFVDGEASNSGSRAALLPALEIRVTATDGRATRYKLGTSDEPLAPGGRFAFSSRLEVPKYGVKTVSVAFGE